MKKILNIGITCYPSIGGSGIVATELGNELARRGHNVHFITYEKPFRMDAGLKNIFFHKVNINEYELFKYPDYTLPLAEKMVEVNKKYALDILHVHYAVPHATAALMARAISKQYSSCCPKVITTLHGTDITLLALDPNLDSIIKFSIENSSGVTAVSKSLKQETKKILSTQKAIEVIYNFYEPKSPSVSREKIRSKLKVKQDEFLLIHMSNLRAVKRIPDLLNILSLVPKKHKVKLLILSGGGFAPYMPLARKLGIQNQIIIKSGVRDIENYINASDAGIYTSDTESFGMGILETMSYGKPVLATKAGGVPEVIADKKTGLLYELGNLKGFVQGITSLIKDKKFAATLGANAKVRAARLFDTQKIVDQYEEYYRKILNS
jgi:N-acetyl-alpha-D-glucosaminyl L-malate synthase BshA